jgi:hypothetical protein
VAYCNGGYITDVNFVSALGAVLTNCIHLHDLHLANDNNGDTLAVIPMPQLLANAFAHCRNLRWLEIECYDVSDSQMVPAIASLCWLDIVALPAATGLTDAFLCALAQNCRDLSCLGIHSSAQVTEAALVSSQSAAAGCLTSKCTAAAWPPPPPMRWQLGERCTGWK